MTKPSEKAMSIETPTTDTLLTFAEVRQICKVSRTTVWKWQAEYGLKTVVIAGIKRVRHSHLDEFLRRYESNDDPDQHH